MLWGVWGQVLIAGLVGQGALVLRWSGVLVGWSDVELGWSIVVLRGRALQLRWYVVDAEGLAAVAVLCGLWRLFLSLLVPSQRVQALVVKIVCYPPAHLVLRGPPPQVCWSVPVHQRYACDGAPPFVWHSGEGRGLGGCTQWQSGE